MHICSFILFLLSSWICYGNAAKTAIGAPKDEDPNNPKYQKMAEQVVRFHIKIKEEDTTKITVYKVSTQLVAGTVTSLQFRVFLVNGKSSLCNARIWEKPWDSVKLTVYKCDSILSKPKRTKIFKPRPKKSRNPSNPKYQNYAHLLLDYYFSTPGSKPFTKEDVKSLTVIKAEVQIVSQITITLIFDVVTRNNDQFECAGTVLETPWESKNTAIASNTYCHNSQGNTKDNGQSELSDQQIGGLTPQNSNDPKYKQLAKKSFRRYLELHTSIKTRVKKVTVDNVTTQIVAGKMTRIDFRVDPTDGGRTIPCHSEIWEKVNGQLDIKVICHLHGDNIGGPKEQNPNNPAYKKLAKESFDKYMKSHIGPKFRVKQIQLTKVSTQVVAGVITTLDFNVITNSDYKYKCHSEVLDQKWLKFKNITVICDPLINLKLSVSANRPKLNEDVDESNTFISGGQTQQSPNDPEFKQLAKESFQKYLKDRSDSSFVVKELKIINVTTQVVSGIITRMDFKAISNMDTILQCHSEIVEQSWLKIKDITVDCFSPKSILALSGVKKNTKSSLINLAIKDYFNNLNTKETWRVEQTKVASTDQVQTRVGKERVYYHKVEVVVSSMNGDYNIYKCSVVFTKKNHLFDKIPLGVNCLKMTRLMGRQEWVNPYVEKYQSLADKAFQKYTKSSHMLNMSESYDVIVTFVVKNIILGWRYHIDFTVRPVNDSDLKCKATISEDLKNNIDFEEVNCGDIGNQRPLRRYK